MISSVQYNAVSWYFNLVFSIFVTKYMSIVLILSMLGENFQQMTICNILSHFSKKIGFYTACKLFPQGIIWMNCQGLFSEKKYYVVCSISPECGQG